MKTELSLLFLIVTMYCRAQTPQNYTTFEGVNLSLYKYEGAKTMVLANSNSLDAATMTKWVNAMDGTYNFYESATGRQPSVNSATYINNRSTLAKVDKTCGAGCGYLGATGIELQADYFDDFYYDLLNYNQYSQEPFYEFGRNFWFYFNKLDYTSNDPIVTGYAVFMRFMAMEHLGLQGANFNSWTFTQFKDNVKGLLATYMGDPSLNWNNTLGVGQGIPGSSLGATDLFASFCWYLRDTYGETWVQNVWKHAGERPDRLTTQDAVDNFIIASSLAAKVNLTSLFQTWKWPISNDAINYLSTVDYKNYRNADNPANTVSGIDFKYYEGDSWSKVPDYSVLTPVKSGVDTNFVLTSRNRNDNFGYSYSSYINIPADGNYTFYTSSDDGSKLYIGTQLVVDNDGLHGSQERSGSIGLKAGKHAINVDFFERGGGELLEVSYSSSTISKRKIRGNELFRIQAPTNRNPENPTTVVNGLSYKYYEGLDWSTIPNFSSLNSLAEGNIENFSLATRKRDDNFGYAFTGYIEVPTDGSYTFYTNSDDGSKLYIGTTLVVNNDGLHADIEKSGVIGLKAGKHAIRVDFFERGGGEVLGVKYEGPGISKQAIPSNKLYRTGGPSLRDSENPGSVTSGLTYKYFEGTGWSTVENFASLSPIKTGTLANFSLAQRNRSDDFGIEFNGYIKIPADGSYNFFTNSDDGSKLFIGSTLVVDNDGLHGDQQKSGTIGLKKGLHTIKVTFFERNGGEVLNVRYEGVNIAKQLVPDTILFRASSSIRVAASDEMFLGQDVSFYPNPTSQDIHIETVNGDPVYEVVFLNALGNTVKEVHNGNSKLTINISDLDFGVYTVQIKTIANVITKKLRVE